MVGLSARDLLTVPRVPPKRNGAVAFADNVPKLLKHTSTTHQRDSLSGYLLFSFFPVFLGFIGPDSLREDRTIMGKRESQGRIRKRLRA